LSAFDAKIEELFSRNQVGTAELYRYTKRSIAGFIKHQTQLSDISSEWLRKYEAHMVDSNKSYTTISMYLRSLRSIMNDALKRGIITQVQYPFNNYKIPSVKGRKLALTISQIKQVMDYPLTIELDKKYRDLWFFSYLCNGINMNDLFRLRHSDIRNGEVHYFRQKTIRTSRDKSPIIATLLPEMKQIIDRWGTSGEYIFPGLEGVNDPAEQKRLIGNLTRAVNERMKKIGKELGFGNISTYTARHSFATVLKRSGASIAYISESLGHSDLKTTTSYLDSFEKEERIRQSSNLVNF
jgi:integrase